MSRHPIYLDEEDLRIIESIKKQFGFVTNKDAVQKALQVTAAKLGSESADEEKTSRNA